MCAARCKHIGNIAALLFTQLACLVLPWRSKLRNHAQLAQKCAALRGGGDKAGSPASPGRSGSDSGDSGDGASTHLNAAAIVLALYNTMGSPMLAQLVGRFAFCMYDAKQVCVGLGRLKY